MDDPPGGIAIGFLLDVTVEDWIRAGQAIRRYVRLYGRIEPREHLNDVLILASSGRAGFRVVSENAAPFVRRAALLRRMGCPAHIVGPRRANGNPENGRPVGLGRP